jgi:hypothetical protein
MLRPNDQKVCKAEAAFMFPCPSWYWQCLLLISKPVLVWYGVITHTHISVTHGRVTTKPVASRIVRIVTLDLHGTPESVLALVREVAQRARGMRVLPSLVTGLGI